VSLGNPSTTLLRPFYHPSTTFYDPPEHPPANQEDIGLAFPHEDWDHGNSEIDGTESRVSIP